MISLKLNSPVVVRSPNWLGDAVMALPAVRNLKLLLGDEVLTVASPSKIAGLWEACPFVDQVVALNNPRSYFSTVPELRRGKFASALLFPNSLRSALEAKLAGIRQVVGFRGHSRAWLMSRRFVHSDFNYGKMHQVYQYMDLIRPVGSVEDISMPKLVLNPAAETKNQIVVCPGAEYGPAKQWMPEAFAQVAKTLATEFSSQVLVAGMAKDRDIAQRVVEGVEGAKNIAGETSFDEFMRLIAEARLVLCNDSGAMHLAAAFHVPAVAIFGSTEQRLTGPLANSVSVVRHHTLCSPCFLRECPLDFSCMKDLSVERVLSVAKEKMKH